MSNASSIKSKRKTDSPRTPGGISKSLLTPCRRVGLSRKWKKGSVSPFVSPLSINNANIEPEVPEKTNKKRKQCETEEDTSREDTVQISIENDLDVGKCDTPLSPLTKNDDIDKTPVRYVDIPRRNKSKKLLLTLNRCRDQNISDEIKNAPDCSLLDENISKEDISNNSQIEKEINSKSISTPSRVKSKKSKQYMSPLKFDAQLTKTNESLSSSETPTKENRNDFLKLKRKKSEKKIKLKSPNDLSKECIIVLQKSILNPESPNTAIEQSTPQIEEPKQDNTISEAVFDSDSDEIPLNQLNKKEKLMPNVSVNNDILEARNKKKNKELETTTAGKKKASKNKIEKVTAASIVNKAETKPSSQSFDSFDDDDDFEMDKRTILIRKSYVKSTKPLKAKSTGSVTQKDIDDMKSRIEMKKKLLLAKAMNVDTEELRSLIKKWQKGCQDALMELMNLMKLKFPDKQNMAYSEILKTLKIPTGLVGYDSENECFVTPDDKTIILSKFNDM